MMIKSYSELIKLPTFEERFKYCQENQVVGNETFGSNRYLNQTFYHSYEWRKIIRPEIIKRDNACDLGCDGYSISGHIYVHHLNPIRVEDLILRKDWAFLSEYMISCSLDTHNALHYGGVPVSKEPIVRKPNDTAPWLEV